MIEIFLKELKETDFTEEYVSWHSSDHTVFYSGSNRVFTRENLLEEFRRGKNENNIFHYGIFSNADTKLIGVLKLGVVNWSNLSSDMIVFIGDRDYLGKGLAVKAIEQGNKIAFKTHKLRKLFGGMYYENIASVKAYLNAGWIIEGVLKDHFLHNDKPQDRILVACFNPEIFDNKYHKSGLYSFEDIYG
jgi:RimJ/RimL family protein N-acetyltransferase